jgi:N-acetylglucosaminyldiphosphoundecaprenol N-acetyl-beta-D-mannosaminyltransferase
MLISNNIYSKDLENIDLNTDRVINTINPHSYCVSKKDKEFQVALKDSDVLLPDGIGIVWAERVLHGNKISKIAGYDLFLFLMERANTLHQKVFFLGASQATLDLIHAKALVEYPNVTVGSFSPPYKPKFTEADSPLMCAEINAFKPDVLFVGMTAPKQEKWVHKFKDELKVTNICCIGAVFDFYAGNIKRSSDFWINLGFEWLPRLIKEPKRLFHRNFVSTPKFILEVLSFKIFGKGIL